MTLNQKNLKKKKDKTKVQSNPSSLPSTEHLLPSHISPQGLSPDFEHHLSLPIPGPSTASIFLPPAFPLPGIQHGLVHNAAITMAQFDEESTLGDFVEYGSSGIPK